MNPDLSFLFVQLIFGYCTVVVYVVSVTINLIDVNDEPPRFLMQPFPYYATFNADLPPESPVNYDIVVSDADADSVFEFSLQRGGYYFIHRDRILVLLVIKVGMLITGT